MKKSKPLSHLGLRGHKWGKAGPSRHLGGRLGPGAAGRGGAGSVAAAPHSDPAWPLCGAGGTERPLALLSRDTHTYTKRDTPLEDAQQCVGDIGQDHPGFCLIPEVSPLCLKPWRACCHTLTLDILVQDQSLGNKEHSELKHQNLRSQAGSLAKDLRHGIRRVWWNNQTPHSHLGPDLDFLPCLTIEVPAPLYPPQEGPWGK